MSYCPNCGTEHEDNDRYCRNCGGAIGDTPNEKSKSETGLSVDGADSEDWNFLNPKGPFQAPRTALNYFNTTGMLLIIIAILLIAAGVESPYAVLPAPLPILLVIYILAVIFVGMPVWFILLLTDNVLGFLRHG